MRLGLFGGTFDPVHTGHLILAEACREQCRLDAVWFIPAATPPHKRHAEITHPEARVEMLQLAIGGNESFHVSHLELERGDVSYTIDTLRALSAEDPTRELFLMLGADSLNDLPHWRSPEEICRLALPLVARRPETPVPDFSAIAPLVSPERLEEMRAHVVDMPRIGLSSSELRRRVAQGRSIRYLTPRAVEKYIETAGLYRTAAEETLAAKRPEQRSSCGEAGPGE
jgi:nicotinate-nucleotide adenylyltransferase